MPNYRVQVRVDFDFEVEAENETAAEELGWYWEDHTYSGDVYNIVVDEIIEEDEDDEDED